MKKHYEQPSCEAIRFAPLLMLSDSDPQPEEDDLDDNIGSAGWDFEEEEI